ncbi:MAG: hypothetical protein HC886_14735 [Leptolyngbyaceae cyanobacterium SM1_1_3]|nr:hypothetical protein [Leptolyngbyaceae cyanobacterium SM1_1_3]NJN02301.1 hypothetical protein [Leptolyngbyaceae cyanobacterium RM1_1_2]NJO11489.1 hypothetical protein [Leptolyngbyaceae cyanobacterium SL_1_1]
MQKRLIATFLSLVILVALASQVFGQADSGLSSRIARIEFDLQNVRTRLSQLESQVSRPQPAPARPPSQPTPAAPSPLDPSLAEQFDNLAILTLELKQRVVSLEDRVNELEQP